MEIVIFIFGFVIGIFLWATIIGTLFASLPIQLRLIRMGKLKSLTWGRFIISILFASVVIVAAFVYLPTAFYGSLFGAVAMLFNIKNLRQEELSKHLIAEEAVVQKTQRKK